MTQGPSRPPRPHGAFSGASGQFSGTSRPVSQLPQLPIILNANCNEGLAVNSTGFDSVNSQFDSGSFPDRNKGGTLEYANLMLASYDKVAAAGLPNFLGAQIPVPINLNLKAWCEIAVISDELQVVAFLTFGCPAGYEGPIPSPSTDNHTSAKATSVT